MLLARRSRDVFSMLWRVRRTLVSWANSSVGIQFCSTPPVLPDPAVRPDPTRPWFVRVLDSTGQPVVNRSLCSSIGLNGVSLVHASGEWFRRRVCVFDALGRTGGARPLGEIFCRRPDLPSAAPPCAPTRV